MISRLSSRLKDSAFLAPLGLLFLPILTVKILLLFVDFRLFESSYTAGFLIEILNGKDFRFF
jgi:hypothetical protein